MSLVRFLARGPTLLLLAVLLNGCEPSTTGTLDVYAASSLTNAFADIEAGFEASHPGADVRLHLAGSQTLRLQIEQGAPADVFVSADERHVAALASAGLTGSPTAFATNELVLIVPAGRETSVSNFGELPRAGRIVLGAPEVPIGAYTRQALEKRGVDFARRVADRVVSEEPNVRLVRAKVELGEVDAAIVYRSDARGRPKLATVEIPDRYNVRASYFAAVVDESPRAAEFVTYLSSDAGAAILERHGFGSPEAP